MFYIVYPTSYEAYLITSVNGSSATGNCEKFSTWPIHALCEQPTSSVLFDSNIPGLHAGFDNDGWATTLLTLKSHTDNNVTYTPQIATNFTGELSYVGVRNIEVFFFNCPQWGISIREIRVTGSLEYGIFRYIASKDITLTSCESLVYTCIQVAPTLPIKMLELKLSPGSSWVHIGEIQFTTENRSCTGDYILAQPIGMVLQSYIL